MATTEYVHTVDINTHTHTLMQTHTCTHTHILTQPHCREYLMMALVPESPSVATAGGSRQLACLQTHPHVTAQDENVVPRH